MSRVTDAGAKRRSGTARSGRKTPEARAHDAARRARLRGAAPAGPLEAGPWHDARHVSAHFLTSQNDQQQTRRHVRFAWQEILWRESRLERVRKCGRTPITEGYVRLKDVGGRAYYEGLATCGSIWACPVCAAKIRNRRSEEITQGAAKWAGAGKSVYMATFTMPHDAGMRLSALMDVISGGFRAVLSGRAWAGESRSEYQRRVDRWAEKGLGRARPVRRLGIRDRLGIVGTIRSMEVTHGEHGWHPHLHVLVFMDRELSADELEEFQLYLRDRWRRYVVKCGYRPPSDEHGVDVQRCVSATDAGKYIAKLQESGRSAGNEMTRLDMKSGGKSSRTPVEILDDFRWTGDAADLRLWHEYEDATSGRQCITWSKGLRKLLLDQEDDEAPTNEEIAAEEVGGEPVADVPRETWRAITKVPGLRAALLDGYERGRLVRVNRLLERHGIPAIHPPPEMVTRSAP